MLLQGGFQYFVEGIDANVSGKKFEELTVLPSPRLWGGVGPLGACRFGDGCLGGSESQTQSRKIHLLPRIGRGWWSAHGKRNRAIANLFDRVFHGQSLAQIRCPNEPPPKASSGLEVFGGY